MPSVNHDFSKSVKASIARRASYICSNPECRSMTISLRGEEPYTIIFKGKVVHICGPTHHGARYDPTMTINQRRSMENAIFLCNDCAGRINRNRGADFPAALLREWKEKHKQWVRVQMNRSQRLAKLTEAK